MSNRHAICLVVDGLRAAALGTYGNTSFPTPALDALASRALVADWLWADSPHLSGFYRSVWEGAHALRPDADHLRESIPDRLHQAGVQQWLVTDEPWLSERAGHLPFDKAFDFENDADDAAEQLEDTALGRYFSEVVDQLQLWRDHVADTSSLAWLHCRGLYGPWDAPPDLREDLLEEEDPSSADFVHAPSALRDVDDPDVLLMHRVAYAAQIAVLDACVGAFVEAVEEVFAESETLITLVGSRGFTLGEHGSIGTDCEELFGERLHLPWVTYQCGNRTPLPRHSTLTQPADIGATLLDWLEAKRAATPSDGISCMPLLTGGACEQRRLAVSASENGERSIRTPAWVLRQPQQDGASEQTVELYTKPDDRWESNDVAGLCPEVVELLGEELANYERNCRCGDALPLAPRSDELILPSR